MNQLFLASLGFSLFIPCPRMAGMANVVARSTNTNLVLVSIIGTVIALPLIIAMVLIFKNFGIWAAMAFAIVTDLLAALIMGAISWKHSL